MAETINVPGGQIIWDGATVEAQFKAAYAKRLRVAGAFLQGQIQKNLSTSSSPTRSLPGQYPHADTGRLRQSIFFQVDTATLTLTVGTPLAYGIMLELGEQGSGKVMLPTSKKALSWIDPVTGMRRYAKSVMRKPLMARPWLARSFVENQMMLKQILEAKLPEGSVGSYRIV